MQVSVPLKKKRNQTPLASGETKNPFPKTTSPEAGVPLGKAGKSKNGTVARWKGGGWDQDKGLKAPTPTKMHQAAEENRRDPDSKKTKPGRREEMNIF